MDTRTPQADDAHRTADNSRDSPAVITLHGVTHRYPGLSRHALDPVSLTMAPGALSGILGHSGAGKPALIRTIVGPLHPKKGQVSLYGAPVASAKGSIRDRLPRPGSNPDVSAHRRRGIAAHSILECLWLVARRRAPPGGGPRWATGSNCLLPCRAGCARRLIR